jgi:hypothetical protein
MDEQHPPVHARPLSATQVSPQATKPSAQVYWQAPLVQVAVALGRLHGVHEAPHAAVELVPG